MIDASKPMIPQLDVEKEYEELGKLYKECTAFLLKWKADRPFLSVASADAMVTVFELHAQIVARRSYILGTLKQEKLPF